MDQNNDAHPEPKYSIGDMVVINSYPDTNPLSGDPLLIPPIMVVTGFEIEDKKKKTHDTITGKRIAERIKYELIWFDNKKSIFVTKIMYQSFLKPFSTRKEHKNKEAEVKYDYQFGGKVCFITSAFELEKNKKSTSTMDTKYTVKGADHDNIKHVDTTTQLLTFVCPDLVVTGYRKNEVCIEHDDYGKIKKLQPEYFVKVMWFNHLQQKYSETELPEECLLNI